jgi:hypothetical protein
MTGAPRNGPQRCAPQQLPCIKMALAWLSFSINSALNLLPWPQEGLVYIDLKLVIISQLPPKIWPQKGPNIPQKWAKISNNRHKINKMPCVTLPRQHDDIMLTSALTFLLLTCLTFCLFGKMIRVR